MKQLLQRTTNYLNKAPRTYRLLVQTAILLHAMFGAVLYPAVVASFYNESALLTTVGIAGCTVVVTSLWIWWKTVPEYEGEISWKVFVGTGMLVTGFLLFFHIVPSALRIFPKTAPNFSNTWILESDIQELERHYNDADFLEQRRIEQTGLFKALYNQHLIRIVPRTK